MAMNEQLRKLVLDGRLDEAKQLAGRIVSDALPMTEANMRAVDAAKRDDKAKEAKARRPKAKGKRS